MTALALISGRLFGEPRIRATKNGGRVCFFSIKVATVGGAEWWSVTTFDNDAINQVAELFDCAPIAATGEMTLEEWEREGKRGINRKLLADAVLIAKSRKKTQRQTREKAAEKPPARASARDVARESWAAPASMREPR